MWSGYIANVTNALSSMVVTDAEFGVIDPEEGFARWCAMARRRTAEGFLHFIGNGASASLASHFAADITKNCGVRACVHSDAALITALGNDFGYENAFAVALARYAKKGDMLVAISSSGESANIVNACLKAAEIGMEAVTVSAKKPDNRLRRLGILNFYFPAPTFSLAESAHAVVLHHMTDCLEKTRGEA